MRSSKVARRYAKGLLEFANETGTTESVFQEMKTVISVLNTSKELQAVYKNPFIDARKKIALTGQIFGGVSPTMHKFLALVINQGREEHLAEIGQQFVVDVEEIKGIQRIQIVTAVQLTQKNIDEILRNSSLVDPTKKSEVSISIRPEILGGYILRMGDQQVDASVRTKLSNIRKSFQEN